MSTSEPEPRRTEIVEQSGCPTVRFTIDDHSFILPYAYFVKGECHIRDKNHFLIIGYWNGAKITILGEHLEQLVQWLAEYRLASVHLRTAVQTSGPDDLPHIEQILVEANDDSSSRNKGRRRKPKRLIESVGHA